MLNDGTRPRRLLCLRLRSMGDAVLMTPALAALRRGFAGAEIHVVLAEELCPLLEGHPDLDRIHALGRTATGKLALAARLRRLRFDVVIDFHGGPTSAFLTAAAGARTRVGRSRYRFSPLYTHVVGDPEVIFSDPAASHTVHVQASLVAALGAPVTELAPRLEVKPAARERVDRRLASRGVSGESFVLLQPTASFATKTWPAARFVELGEELRRRTGRQVVVSLPSDESALVGEFSGFPTVTRLPADELVALSAGAALYVGNDGGPMHVAAALGVPVVAVFGSSDPRRWHPWGVEHRTLWAGLPCSPCHGKWCANPRQLACLDAISVGAALDAALGLLARRAPGRPEGSLQLLLREVGGATGLGRGPSATSDDEPSER